MKAVSIEPQIDVPIMAEGGKKITLCPLTIYCFPSSVFLAVVFRFARSEPPDGSVAPRQKLTSPVKIPGSQAFFCFAVPNALYSGFLVL
jgi:hypothetical protein